MSNENKKERFGIFKKIHEYSKIPRYRSLMILGMYFLFFLIVIIYVKIMGMLSINVEPENKIDALTYFRMMDNYEYSYVLETNILDRVYTVDVDGIRYDDVDNFDASNYDFYVKDNIIYSSGHEMDIIDILPIDLLALRPNRLYEAINYSVDKNSIQYQDGDSKVTYKIPVSKYNAAFLQGIEESDEVIEITTYESNGVIYKLELDIYNLMKLVNSEFESYTVVIEYSNINNIESVEN